MNQDFNILHNYVYKFDQQCQFAVTTMYVPASTIEGEELVDIYSKENGKRYSINC